MTQKEIEIQEQNEKLKNALFMEGTEALDDFTGVNTANMEKDTIENLMDQVLDQMPDEEFQKFYDKYVGKESDPEDDISIYSMNDLINAYHAMTDYSGHAAILLYMSNLTGKSVDYLMNKVNPA